MKDENTKAGTGRMEDMMQNMMKGMGAMPEMCMKMMQQMTGTGNESAGIASYATAEMQGLFEEWARALEEEIMAFVKERQRVTPSDIATNLKISEESVLFFLGRMARAGKLVIGEIRVAE